MLLLSWNVAGRVKRLPEQAERIAERARDVVCLQEVTPSTLPRWRALLHDAGYLATEHGDLSATGRKRPLAVLTASRTPLHAVLVDGVPWAGACSRCSSATAAKWSTCTRRSVPSPMSPRSGLTRPCIGIWRTSLAATRGSSAGDLTTPRREHADGTVWTFARIVTLPCVSLRRG